MIVYQLACDEGHFFEGWFASSEACASQAAAGRLSCPTCSSPRIRKLPSAPHVRGSAEPPSGPGAPAGAPALQQKALLALRKFILSNTEDVGLRFAEVARRIYYDEEKARGIRGRATVEQAAELQEEGIPALAIAPGILPAEDVH